MKMRRPGSRTWGCNGGMLVSSRRGHPRRRCQCQMVHFSVHECALILEPVGLVVEERVQGDP